MPQSKFPFREKHEFHNLQNLDTTVEIDYLGTKFIHDQIFFNGRVANYL